MNLEFGLALLVSALLAWVWLFYIWQRRAIRHRPYPAEPASYPSLSIIRPIKGLDSGVEENLRAAFDHGYRGDVETLFVFDDDDEPILPMVEKVIAEKKAVNPSLQARVIFSGQPPTNRTGKLNAMIHGLEASRGELIAFVDSDIRQDRDDLPVLVATLLADDKAGSAFPTVISTQPPRTVGDVGYALMINGLYEPAALATAHQLGGALPFIMGHIMVFRREAIQAIGGLESAEGQLVDDMFIGRRLNEFGYLNKISPKPAAIIQQDLSLHDFVQILIRWIAFSMSGLPLLTCKLPHWLTGMAFWLGFIASLTGLATGNLPLALYAACAPLSVAATINDLHQRMAQGKLPWKYAWGSLVIWLAAPLIYFQIWTRREINWRGRRYRLDMHSRLS
ncbi:MAG: glycosyltransferase [Methylococcus sp.]